MGEDAGQLQRVERLQAPARVLRARGRGLDAIKPAKHVQQLDDEFHDEQDGECICDEPAKCYVCYDNPLAHAHGHGEHHDEGHDEGHDDEHLDYHYFRLLAAGDHISLSDDHGGGHGHGHHHSMYSKDHTWGTKINYYSIIPDCCENPSISSERYPDSSYNQPCSMDADELAMFEHYGSPKVCDAHDMQEAQTFTHSLNVWMVMLVSVLWMTLLIWGAELLKNCGGVHEHGHGHDDHGHGDGEGHGEEAKAH